MPPLVLLLVANSDWLQPGQFPFGQVDGLLRIESFGNGVMIHALEAVSNGQRYEDPALQWLLAERAKASEPALKLTPREQDTLVEIGRALTNRQIASRLGIAESTACEYTKNLLQKLWVRNRTQRLSASLERGLIRPRLAKRSDT